MHFVGTYQIEGSSDRTSTLFLNTKEDSPFKFTIGEGNHEIRLRFIITILPEQTLPGLENAVATMKEGEKCFITVHSEYAYGPNGNPQVTK